MAKKIKLDKAKAAEKPVDAEAAIDADAAGDDEAPVVPESASAPEPPDYDRIAAKLWPVEDDHGSVTRMLTQAADREVDLAEVADEANRTSGSNTLNLILLLLIIAATGVGIWQLRRVSSPETLAAKAAEREALEQQHLSEQLAKQKKYGVLRIESEPPQAVVIKDGEKLVAEVAAAVAPPPAEGATPPAAGAEGTAAGTPPATPAAGGEKPATPPAAGAEGAAGAPAAGEAKQLVGMTPMNIMNLDISQQYTIRLEKEGYEPFEFSVAEHLWVKDPTTSEYKFFKAVEMTPINCEYYFLYDAKKRREVQFKDKADCLTHYDEAVNQQVSVTECVCKIPPEGIGGEKKDQ
ncbi:MAG: hypothetical protein R3F65_27470 [bacterium]